MNPRINALRTYPFTRLAQRLAGAEPPAELELIAMHIGEPRHAPPASVAPILGRGNGLASYPPSAATPELRASCANSLRRRYRLPDHVIDADRMIVPVNGTREGLFSFVQAMCGAKPDPVVILPNPFYQIYEGAAILAGAEPYYVNTLEQDNFIPQLERIPASIWERCEVLFLCSPGNPSGTVLTSEDWQQALALADRHDFVVAADECYADIYRENPDGKTQPPLGALEVCHQNNRDGLERIALFHSLSKRSNVPGLRSGFIATSAELATALRQYREYHGCAMAQTVQDASIAAWDDDTVPQANRALYDAKYAAWQEILGDRLSLTIPPGAFYHWIKTPGDDREFVRELFAEQHVKLLPGQYLAREANGINPGAGWARVSLVPELAACTEAAQRIRTFLKTR